MLSEFRELKSDSGKILRDIDVVVGYGTEKLSAESLRCIEILLQQHSRLQEEMLVCAAKLKVVINGVKGKVNELAAVSNPNAVINDEEEKEVDPPEPLPDVVQVPKKKRGRKPKQLTNDSSPVVVDGLDLLANAVSMVSLDVVKIENVVRTKKVPITKFKKKTRKRSKNSDARESKDEEQTDDDDDPDDSTEKPDEELFCICNRRSAGDMIGCDNVSALIFNSKFIYAILFFRSLAPSNGSTLSVSS